MRGLRKIRLGGAVLSSKPPSYSPRNWPYGVWKNRKSSSPIYLRSKWKVLKPWSSLKVAFCGPWGFPREFFFAKRDSKPIKSPPWTKNAFLAPFCDPNAPQKFDFSQIWQCLPYSFGVSKWPKNGFLQHFCCRRYQTLDPKKPPPNRYQFQRPLR